MAGIKDKMCLTFDLWSIVYSKVDQNSYLQFISIFAFVCLILSYNLIHFIK